jgi:hypothetical protein
MRKRAQIVNEGIVEGAWWVPSAGIQWRVRGHAWVVSAALRYSYDSDGHEVEGNVANYDEDGERMSDVRAVLEEETARSMLQERMYEEKWDTAEGKAWSWEAEVAAWYAAQSPRIRGAFSYSLHPHPHPLTLLQGASSRRRQASPLPADVRRDWRLGSSLQSRT